MEYNKLNFLIDIIIFLFYFIWDAALCTIAIQSCKWGIVALTAILTCASAYFMIENIVYLVRGSKNDT